MNTCKNNDSKYAPLENLLLVIEDFRFLDPEVQAQTIKTFLLIGINSGKNGMRMSHLAEMLDISQSSVSRNVGALSKYNRHDEPGLWLVESYIDPSDARNKLLRLTRRGEQMAMKLSNYIS